MEQEVHLYVSQEASMKLAKEKDPKKYLFLFVLLGVFVYLIL